MTATQLQREYVGKTITGVEYNDGDPTAYLVLADGSALEVPVEPTWDEEG